MKREKQKGQNNPQAAGRRRNFRYGIVLEGLLTGLLTGVLVSLLRFALHEAESIRTAWFTAAKVSVSSALLVLLGLAACYGVICLCIRFAPFASGSGIPQLTGELHGKVDQPAIPTLLGKMVGTVASIGAGLSMGNEGPSVQVGAMCGKFLSRRLRRVKTEEKLLLTAGAGAGLACAFGAPFAGVMFALECIRRSFSREVFVSTMAAAIAADFVGAQIFGFSPVVTLTAPEAISLNYYWLLPILGVLVGALGVGFNRVTDLIQDFYTLIPSKYLRPLVPLLLVIPVAYFCPKALGTGYSTIVTLGGGGILLGTLIGFMVVKFFYSILSATSGAQGGIFLPILVLGAATGTLLYLFFHRFMDIPNEYLGNFVLLGMTGYFASVIRAPLTGVLLITEMTGNFNNFLSLGFVALVAYITAEMLHGQPIYEQLMEKMLSTSTGRLATEEEEMEVLVDTLVNIGSRMDGAPVRDLDLPANVMIVSIQRGSMELTTSGRTVLEGGDMLTVLCKQRQMRRVDQVLETYCRQLADEET